MPQRFFEIWRASTTYHKDFHAVSPHFLFHTVVSPDAFHLMSFQPPGINLITTLVPTGLGPLDDKMSSKPARAPSSAQPALRIPTFDSMKRFSAATDFSDMPDFDFTKPTDEDALILPDYLLNEIDVGQQITGRRPSTKDTDVEDTKEGPKLLFNHASIQTAGNKTAESNGSLEARDPPNSLKSIIVPTRTSSRVPFNPSRPVSQITTNDGITALPTLASRGLLVIHDEVKENNTLMLPTSRKRKASSALSGPIKRLRNLSFDSITNKLHKRRGSSLSCTNDVGATVSNEKRTYGTLNAKLNLPIPSPSSAIPSTPLSSRPPTTPTPRYTNTLATSIIPTYPPSSPIHSPTAAPPSSPAQLLLPNDLTCLPALQSLISDLHAENETLKQQVKVLREDWYATHDELLIERYKAWERDCELERLRDSGKTTKGKEMNAREGWGEIGSKVNTGGIETEKM